MDDIRRFGFDSNAMEMGFMFANARPPRPDFDKPDLVGL